MKAHSAQALLVLAVQDLFDGECAWQERISGLRSHITHPELARFADAQAVRSEHQATRLGTIAQGLGVSERGAANIWLRAILDDAHRDTETIERGPFLDTALIGAMRKGIQSERVSYETALEVAHALAMADAAGLLTLTHGEEVAADSTLKTLLHTLAAATS